MKLSGQCKKQMDVLIRYWSETSACIQVHYLNSLFYGHAFAERISKDLVDCFNGLVDVGFCYIHAIHNAFKAGNQMFGFKALDFAMNVFYWFHMTCILLEMGT